MSHDWPEWRELTKEIIKTLSVRGAVFAALGGVAREFVKPYVSSTAAWHGPIWADRIDPIKNRVLEFSHPSPRGSFKSRYPFVGSKLFTKINIALGELKQDPIYWKL